MKTTTIRIASVIATLLWTVASPAWAAYTSPFELEGNVKSDVNIDWSSLFDADATLGAIPKATQPAGFGPSFFQRDFKPGASGPDVTTFATGSKDTLPISGWQCGKSNNVNDAIDIVNAYATLGVVNGHLVVYFGQERYDNNGTKDVGFWLLQDDTTSCAATGGSNVTFTGKHKDGDLLIVSEFTQGGGVSTIKVFRWNGDNPGALSTTPALSGADCKNAAPGENLCATINTTTIVKNDIPWVVETNQSGGSPSNNLAPGELFEGVIDLTGSNLAACFGAFLTNTRSSASTTATLFDFVAGKFSVCGMNVTKSCTSSTTNGTSFDVDFMGTVVNTGGVPITDIEVMDDKNVPVVITNCVNQTVIPQPFVLAPQTTYCYSGEYTSTVNPATDTVSVEGTVGTAGLTDTAEATCTAPVLPAIDVSKSCDNCAINAAGTGFNINFSGTVTNTGNIGLKNIVLTDSKGGTFAAYPSTLAAGGSFNYSGTHSSTTGGSVSDTVSINAAADVTNGAPVSDTSGTATCSCQATPSVDVTKDCTVQLVPNAQNHLEVKVTFTGTVTNNGTVQLQNVGLSDSPSATFSSPTTLPIATLAPGASVQYSGFYYPSSAQCSYSDTVSVSATGAAGTGTAGDSDGATCAICPAQ